MIFERRKKLQKDKNKALEKENEVERGRVREKERHDKEKVCEKERHEKEKACEKDREKVEKDKEIDLHHEHQADKEMVTDQEDKPTVKHVENGNFGGNNQLMKLLFTDAD